VAQDRLVQRGQLAARLDPQLVGQPPAEVEEPVEGLGLAPGAVQRPQVGGAQPLPQRVAGDELAQLGGQCPVLAERETRLGP
jgi:hypothetical protein